MNSVDGDFDDFKSADSKPSDSSQFTSSEQSENEDFKAFESYLDDFNKKKSELESKQESPLHKPIPKFSGAQSTQLPNNAKLTSVPPIKNLWQKEGDRGQKASIDPKITSKGMIPQLGLSPPQSSDSDFADFQQAPVLSGLIKEETIKKSGSDTCLIGDEDKYAALRVFDSVPVASVFESKGVVGSSNTGAEETDEDSWADFQAVSGEVGDGQMVSEVGKDDSSAGDTKSAILDLYAKSDELESSAVDKKAESKEGADWSGLGNMASNADSDWSQFGNSAADMTVNLSESGKRATGTSSDWSNFTSDSKSNTVAGNSANNGWSEFTFTSTMGNGGALEKTMEADRNGQGDDWADFQGTSSAVGEGGFPQGSTTASASGIEGLKTGTEEADTQANLVQIGKKNLNTNEILGLFKVRDQVPSDLKLEASVLPQTGESKPSDEKTTTPVPIFKPKYSPGLDDDDDPFRIPPPIDDGHDDHEDEYGEFSRGYDLDDVIRTPRQTENRKKNLYNFYGMDVPSEKTKQVSSKDNDKLTIPDSAMSKVSNMDLNDSDSSSSKDADGIIWPTLGAVKAEDSQSVSSLDLQFSKSRIQNVKDADSQSISSNEYGNFETHLKPPSNPESKSVDSLDLKRVDSASMIEQGETGSEGDQSAVGSKEGTPESTG